MGSITLFLAACSSNGSLPGGQGNAGTTSGPSSAGFAGNSNTMPQAGAGSGGAHDAGGDATTGGSDGAIGAVAGDASVGGGAGNSTGGGAGQPRSSFEQGLFRGQDPRLSSRNGNYYYVGYVGQALQIFKSKSLVDQGVGKTLPAGMNATLFAPVYIDTLGGVTYNAWYVFGSTIWKCACADPYDDSDQWAAVVNDLPFTAGAFDFELFRNPQPGPYQNHWYLLWTASVPGGYAESIYAAEVLSLTPGQKTLSTYNSDPQSTTNRLITYHQDWTDIITEAPGIAVNGDSVTMAYSGNGAQTSLYAVGFALLKKGQDPTLGSSWLDYSHGGCDGNVHTGPEFARTADVFGPGVMRFTRSADGNDDWMLYHAKVFDTYDAKSNQPEPQQLHNEEYTRYVNLQAFSWQDVTCSAQTYRIPKLGKPLAAGVAQPLPAGDPGVGDVAAGSSRRIEAEYMIPFGYVMGDAIQSLPTNNTVVLTPTDAKFSSGNACAHFDALARDQPSAPKKSGLLLRNAPGGRQLVVAAAGTTPGSFDLYLDDKFVQTLALQATPDAQTARPNTFAITIPRGSNLQLVYEAGKSAPATIDYLEISN